MIDFFLDTNLIIDMVENGKIEIYKNDKIKFLSFEKCI